MAGALDGRRVAILAADGVERVELEQPRRALDDAGATTILLSIGTGTIAARDNDLEDAGEFTVDRAVADATPDEYDALLLPGGTVNPDKLRMDAAAVAFVRDFVDSGKPVASICHGPWTLLEADRVRGRRLTSWPSVRTDLRNAGGALLCSSWLVFFHYLARYPDLTRAEVDDSYFARERPRALLGVALYLLAGVIGVLVHPVIASAIFLILPVFYGVTSHGHERGRGGALTS